MDDCVFCNIVKREIQSDILRETDSLIVIRDIMPKAPVHLLVVPKLHIPSITDIEQSNGELMSKMIFAAKQIAQEQKIAETGYKLIFNVGRDGGQVIPHVHLHVLGGKQLGE